MSRKNRNLAAKNERAARERSAWAYGEMLKAAITAPRLTDQEALTCAIARQSDVVMVGGRAVRVIKEGVNGRNVAKRQPDAMRPAIIAAHW